jgi:glutamate racemase
MIETKQIDKDKIRIRIDEACKAGADVIVLGCTHYHWIEDIITETTAGRAQVIQPEQAIIKQLRRVISDLEI